MITKAEHALQNLVAYCSTDDEYDSLKEHLENGGKLEDHILYSAAVVGGFENELIKNFRKEESEEEAWLKATKDNTESLGLKMEDKGDSLIISFD